MAIGIKVSLPGYDVETATVEQLAFSSENPPPLMKEEHVGITTYTFDTNIVASSTRNLFKLEHGYSFVPTSVCMVSDGTVWDGITYTIPAPFYNGFVGVTIRSYCDSTYFYIDMINPQVIDVVADNKTYTFKYYIFAEDSQL